MKVDIGLNAEKTIVTVEKMNTLLASYQVFYMNVRGFHWNVKGADFFVLHEKFEELYTNLLEKVDAIAERVLTLGGQPVHAFSDYLKISQVEEVANVSDGSDCIKQTIAGFSELVKQQRALLELATDAEDEGTLSMMSEFIAEQEKLLWMLNAYLG